MQNGSTKDRGVLATCLRPDGPSRDRALCRRGESTTGTVGHVRMDSPEVFRHAVTNIAKEGDQLYLEKIRLPGPRYRLVRSTPGQ